jgi:hypothetical protein
VRVILALAARRTPVLALAASLTLAPALAATPAQASDASATRAYVQADYALSRSAQARLGSAEASLKTFMRRIGSECPKAAAGSSQSLEAEAVYEEVVAVVTAAVYRADAGGITRFARAVRGLRWSKPSVTRTIHGYAARLTLLSTFAAPNVCADVRAWVKNGYGAVPTSTTAAVHWLRRTEKGVLEVPSELLAPYELRAESHTISATHRLEAHLQEIEALRGPSYISKVVALLGLNP